MHLKCRTPTWDWMNRHSKTMVCICAIYIMFNAMLVLAYIGKYGFFLVFIKTVDFGLR